MKLKNQPKVLASTINNNVKTFTVLIDVPYVLLPELMLFNKLSISYKKLDDIDVKDVVNNPFIPIWTKKSTVIPYTNEIDFWYWLDIETEIEEDDDVSETVENEYDKYKKFKESFSLDNLWNDALLGKEDIDMCSTTDNDGFYGTVSEAQRLGYNLSNMNEWIDKGETGINEWYKMLLDRNIDKQQANLILSPFAYTTCIITGKGRDFNNLFEMLCPKYLVPFDASTVWDKTFNSKTEAKSYISSYWEEDGEEVVNHMDTNDVWTKINKSKVRPELQYIAEMLYDLYQSCNWKESNYHIVFEDDINKLLSGKYRLLTDETKSWNKDELPIWIDCESGEEVDIDDGLIKLSASMCSKFSYNTNNESLEHHIGNAAKLIENNEFEHFNHSITW
jgi:hypothetical protein